MKVSLRMGLTSIAAFSPLTAGGVSAPADDPGRASKKPGVVEYLQTRKRPAALPALEFVAQGMVLCVRRGCRMSAHSQPMEFRNTVCCGKPLGGGPPGGSTLGSESDFAAEGLT
jgi:hypothetical protein